MRPLILGSLLVAVAPAWAGEPPRKVTDALAADLVSGRRPLADFVDPTRAVVLVDDGRALSLCGGDLGALSPVLSLASRGLSADPPRCTNNRCEVAGGYRLDFRVDPARGVVLEALVSPADAKAPPARACAPIARSKPVRLTKGLVRELVWGLRPIADVIDPRRGVVRASWPNSGAEDAYEPPPQHLCGRDLDPEKLRRELLHAVIAGETAPYFECGNTSVRECIFSALVDEYSNHHHLVFRDDAVRGLVIESWIDLDEGLSSQESRREQRRWARKLVETARASPCP